MRFLRAPPESRRTSVEPMIRKAALALSGLFLVFLMIGLWLPDAVQVSRSIEIAAQPEKVFPLVNDLRAFQRWSP